jgi:hypothetical protein
MFIVLITESAVRLKVSECSLFGSLCTLQLYLGRLKRMLIHVDDKTVRGSKYSTV